MSAKDTEYIQRCYPGFLDPITAYLPAYQQLSRFLSSLAPTYGLIQFQNLAYLPTRHYNVQHAI